MTTPDIFAARNDLIALLDTPFEEIPPPLTPYTTYPWHDQAKKLIGLAAQFVAALEEAGGGTELHNRYTSLANLTGVGSHYQHFREAAFQRLLLIFKEASPDKEVERLPISQLTSLYMSEQFDQQFLVLEDVKRFAGDPESILWSPHELSDYWGWLAQLLKYPELRDFGYELWSVLRRVKAEHLWGSYLLAVSHSVHRSPKPDWYGDLETTIVNSGGAIMAIKDAADDLFIGLHVDPKQLKKEQRHILQAMLEMGVFSIDEREPASDIIKKALNSSVPDKFKEMMSDLRHRGLAESKEGAGGGYWLTPVGKSVAGNLSDAPVIPSANGMVANAPAASNPPHPAGITAIGPAKQGGSPPLTKTGHRRSASKVLPVRSSLEKGAKHPDWPARKWVSTFLRGKDEPKQESREEIIKFMQKAAPHIYIGEIDDAINNPRDFKKIPQPSRPILYAISDD